MQKLALPAKIANAPELFLGLELFYLAFLCLTTCRGSGGNGEGVISWLAIKEYCQWNEVTGEQQDEMFYHIQRMDSTYLNFKYEKIKREMAGK